MEWLGKLLRLARTKTGPMRDLRPLVAPLVIPAVVVRESRAPSRSHLGGEPHLPPDVPWPDRNGRRLELLARISLPELQQALSVPWLPASGALLFFYDVEEQPWGFDPKDRGGWAVIHVADLPSPVAVDEVPGTREGILGARNVRFERIDSLPSIERAEERGLLTGVSDAEFDTYHDLASQPFARGPSHQIGGWPLPIQADGMELEAQLASHGVYCGNPAGYESPEAMRLEGGAKDWRLLLQLDSDEHMDVMWGDAGILYFWVREQEAAAGRFDNVWAILQCH